MTRLCQALKVPLLQGRPSTESRGLSMPAGMCSDCAVTHPARWRLLGPALNHLGKGRVSADCFQAGLVCSTHFAQ